MIRIDDDGTVRIEPYLVDIGFQEKACTYAIHLGETRRATILARLAEESALEFEEVVKVVSIDDTGGATVRLRFANGAVRA